MKIRIGKEANSEFYVEGDAGLDITGDLKVRSLTITAGADAPTMVEMTCYLDQADVEIEGSVVVTPGADILDRIQHLEFQRDELLDRLGEGPEGGGDG